MERISTKPTREELRAWLAAYLAELLGTDARELDPQKSFEVLGLDSSGAVGLSGDLEHVLGVEFETSLVYDHPSLDLLVEHLVERELVTAG